MLGFSGESRQQSSIGRVSISECVIYIVYISLT